MQSIRTYLARTVYTAISGLTGLLLLMGEANAATYEFQLGSSYQQNGFYPQGLPATSALTDVSGSLEIDANSGELTSMFIDFGTYTQLFILSNPFDDYANFEYSETQTLTAPATGLVNGDTIEFTNLDFTASGSGVCTLGVGAGGTAACNAFTGVIAGIAGLDMTLALTSNGDALLAEAVWTSMIDNITISHELDIFAVAAVPVPGAAWFLGSALLGLSTAARRRCKGAA